MGGKHGGCVVPEPLATCLIKAARNNHHIRGRTLRFTYVKDEHGEWTVRVEKLGKGLVVYVRV